LDQFLAVTDAFESRENVNVKVLTYRGEDLSSVLPAQFQAEQSLADIVFMWDWWVKENSQYAVDLSDVWATVSNTAIPEAIQAGGKVAAVPYVMSAKPGFWYRKSFFREHGLSEPKTRAEFEQLLRDIAAIDGIDNPIVTGDGVGWPISDVTEHMIIAVGGPELERDLIAGTASWTSSRVKSVFTGTIVPMLQANAFSDPIEWTQAVELWWNEEYGLYFMGAWITGMVDDSSDLGVFPFPGAKGIVSTVDTAFVPKFSENQTLAKKLLTFMLSKEGQEIRAREGGKLVIRKDVSSSLYPEADQAVAALVSQMDTTVNDLDDSVGGDWQRLFWDQLKLLWVQPSSLDEVLAKLEQGRQEE
jgi:multiple sugar transport system substrate-binding protein